LKSPRSQSGLFSSGKTIDSFSVVIILKETDGLVFTFWAGISAVDYFLQLEVWVEIKNKVEGENKN
jgi:hypothetical protein